MRIAYLINRYPLVSHTFIRREIQALEQLGVAVERYSIRRGEVADELDRPEAERTQVILDAGPLGLVAAVCVALVTRPVGWCRALAMAVRCGRRSQRGLLRHLVYFAEAVALARLMRRDGVEHLHAHFATNPTMVAMLAHALSGVGYSFTVHGPEEFDQPAALSLPEKIARARFVVAISEFGRSQVFRWCPHDQWSKVHVVRCTVDRSFFDTPLEPLPDEPRLVCVGRLGPEKGQQRLVEACARLRERGVGFELVLVGGGAFTERTRALIDRLGLGDRVTVTGWVDGGRVREQINRARLMVMPTFAEGLPVVFMEALALGRPVVSTYVAGIPELVVPGETGWLIPAGSTEAIVEVLEEALSTPVAQLAEMGRCGRARVAELHNASNEAAKLARLFAPADLAPGAT